MTNSHLDSAADTQTDRFASARAVADAVLYEGYVLYPYRASSQKNRVRFQFGVVAPRAFSELDSSECWTMRTECIVEPHGVPPLFVRVRFLQAQHRSVSKLGPLGTLEPVDKLEADGRVFVEWDEAVEQVLDLPPLSLTVGAECDERFSFDGRSDSEPILADDGSVAGEIVRRRQNLSGAVRVVASAAGGSLVKLSVTVENTTPWTPTSGRRDDAITRSLVAVHTMLAVQSGRFISLLDPAPYASEAVANCENSGTFPILIGEDDVMLSSPIILYDHPEVAPESPGDLYDATEIDEILALRILTLTDEEKAEARGTDPRAAAIVDRCDNMAPELWERLHGAVRSLRPQRDEQDRHGVDPADLLFDQGPVDQGSVDQGSVDQGSVDQSSVADASGFAAEEVPWWDPVADASVDPWSDAVLIGGVEVRKGSAVVLRPSHRSDAQDLFLAGLEATVAGVFRDVDGEEHVAVTIDTDPATEAFEWQGRYLFFHLDEVEPVTEGPRSTR